MAYVELAPSSGHSGWFLTRTSTEHRATVDHPLMRALYARKCPERAYAAYLAGQLFAFERLEAHCAGPSGRKEPLRALLDPDLARGPALRADCASWGSDVAEPTAATRKYLRVLDADASRPELLLCHHFLQYNACLSGGQFLAKCAGGAAEFYAFPASCQPPHERVQRYLATLDEQELLREPMLAKMREVYALLLGMFDEAFALAPAEGIDFAAAKQQALVPPPPLEPLPRVFSLDALKAGPMKTAVLGRVYDVDGAKDLFGPGAAYHLFVGHDGTWNLAAMSLKAKTLDLFAYELDEEEKETLSDWIAYFDNRYGRPVGTLDKAHPYTLSDLPRAKKIPFSSAL